MSILLNLHRSASSAKVYITILLVDGQKYLFEIQMVNIVLERV